MKITKHLIVLLFIALFPTTVFSQLRPATNIVIDNNGVKLQGYFRAVNNKEGRFPTLILLQGFTANGSDLLGLGKQLVQSNINVVSIEQYMLPLYRALQEEKAAQVSIKAFQDNHGFSKSRKEISKTVIDWINDLK